MKRLLFPLVLLSLVWVAGARADWPGRPKGDPPRLHQKGPPPAWIETPTRSTWLAFGSYCWTTVCADMVSPSLRKDIPQIAVKRGDAVRIHLAFAPRTAQVVVMLGDRPRTLRLPAKPVLVWRPGVTGLALVDVRGLRGSAGYLFRLRVAVRAG